MSLLSTPIKGEIATQKNIFRLAATMYANTSDTYSTTETQLQMIICVFIEDSNRKKDYCCLEYCLLINGDSTNKLLSKSLKKRTIYLDTNIIFRALGINGVSRQKVITAFLDKCLQANINLIISWHTKQEFELTIQHYIAKIEQFPHGNIYLGAFESLSDYTIFSYYDDWRRNHKGLSLKYFTASINSAYKALVKKYGILDNEKIPYQIYDSEDFKTIRNSYSTSIQVCNFMWTLCDIYCTSIFISE